MKRNLPFLLIAFVAILTGTGCSHSNWDDYRGQLLGMQDRPVWEPINPFGMVYIPSGTLHVGPSDQDVNNSLWQRTKSISIQGFYMDDAEITNNEYRQFVYWVRDSISHVLLDHYVSEEDGQATEEPKIDWTLEIDYEDEETKSRLDEIYLPGSETYYGQKQIDTRQLVFSYRWAKWKEAASKSNRDKNIADFIVEEPLEIYPDTLTWVHDYTYSYNEPMTRQYFSHPAFDDYPVVGVSWKQASAFTTWRTDFWNDWRRAHEEVIVDDFRLPTEHEWEYAARGGRDEAPYPWGGPYVRNTKVC